MIKRSLFLLVVACTVISSAQAMESMVQLPSEKILKNYLSHGGFASFVSETNIDKNLADREIAPLELFNIISDAVSDYNQRLNETAHNQVRGVGFEVTRPVWIKKESVLKCILCGRQDLYQALLEHAEKLANRQSKL